MRTDFPRPASRRPAFPRRGLLPCLLLALLFAGLPSPLPLLAQKGADLPVARKLQASIIHNFIRFTTWPQGALPEKADLLVGVVDDDSSAEPLCRELDGLSVSGHRIHATLLDPGATCEGLHVVILPRKAPLTATELAARLARRPVLSIGEAESFTREGGMIRLFMRRDTFHFSLNPRAAREAGLTLSSQLDALAEKDAP